MTMISWQTISAIFEGIMSWFFWLVMVFFIAMVFDYVTGSLAARKNKAWTSTKAREGLYHKLGIAGALILAVLIDVVVGLAANTVIKLPVSFRGLFSPLCAVWYIVTEFGSVAENLHKMGVAMPTFITKGLAVLYGAAEDAGREFAEKAEKDKADK